MRPHVLWFDEYYGEHVDYEFDRVLGSIDTMELALIVGTSFAVGVTEAVLRGAATRQVPAIHIEPTMRAPVQWVTRVTAKAEEVLPQVVDVLRAG